MFPGDADRAVCEWPAQSRHRHEWDIPLWQPGNSTRLLLWAPEWLSQLALVLWPYRKDQEEVSLRNGDDSVSDTSRNSDCGSRNPKEEKAYSHSGSSQTNEQPGSSSIKAGIVSVLWLWAASVSSSGQKWVSGTNKYKPKITASIQNPMAHFRNREYNLHHIFPQLLCLKLLGNICKKLKVQRKCLKVCWLLH